MADLGTIVGASPLDADDTTYFTSNNQPAVQTTTVALGNTPSDFGNMDTGLLYQLIARLRDAPPGADFDTYTIEWCIVNAAQDTVLAGASTTYASRFEGPTTITADSDQTIGSPTAFTITNTTASKSDWDNALIELRFNTSAQDMSPDNNAIQADYFQITGTYTVASGEVTSSASPAVAITNISGTDTLPVTYVYTINTGTQGVINNAGYVPTITTEGGVVEFNASPAVGILNLAGYAPTVTKTKGVFPSNGVVNLQGYAATVSKAKEAFPNNGVINALGYAPTVTKTKESFPNNGAINAVGYAPTVTKTKEVSPANGVVNIQGYAPTIQTGAESTASPSNGVVNVVGYAPTVETVASGYSPSSGVVNVIGISPGPVTYVYTINTGTQGTLNVQGYQPTVLVGDVTPNGLVQVIGYTPVITRDKTFYPSAGRVNIQGTQAETGVSPGLGVINVSGSAPDVRRIGAGWRNPTNGVVRVAMTGTTPTVDIIRTIDGPAGGVINIAGGSPTSQQPGNVVDAEPQVGVVRLVGYTPSVTYNYRIDVGRGLVNVRGYAGATPKTRKPSVGIIRVSGNVVTVGRVAPVIDKREGGHGTDYDEWDQQIRREDELIVEMLKQWVEVA